MKAFVYVRVSTMEQKKHGLSVDTQLKALQEYCEENDIEIVDIYNDAGMSAHVHYTKRKELLRLIEDAKEGKANIILFTKLDRWFRSVEDYYSVMSQIPEDIPWRSIWEDYETVTSAGRFKVNIMLSIAQAEAERTSERIKSVLEYKKASGDYVGKAPIGYKIINRQLVKDEATQEAVSAIFETYLNTFSSKMACDVAKEHGMPMERQHIIKMLHRTAYYGDAAGGYKCEPYITYEQYCMIQDFMKKSTRTAKEKKVYLFSGLCVCGYCGQKMHGHAVKRTLKDGTIKYHMTYSCSGSYGSKRSCPHLQIQETWIEQYILDNLNSLIGTYKIQNDAVESDDDISTKLKKKKALQDKLKRLATLYADGDMELSEYRKKRDETKAELDSIFVDKRTLPELPEEWKEVYAKLDKQHKQIFFKKIISSIEITNETKKAPKIVLL